MKTSIFKLIFLSALTALFAVACTNEVEHPDSNENGVVARISAEAGGMLKPSAGALNSRTRATNNVWEEGDAIGVTMVKPQTLEVINPYRNFGYNTSGDGKFSPNDASQIIYFPTNDEEVEFKAYYPYNKDLAANLVIPVSTKDQSDLPAIDLMTAEHLSGSSTEDPNVKLHFSHRLAKVVVNLTTDNESISILNGVQVTMRGLKTEAVYDLLAEDLIVDNNLPNADVSIPVFNAKAEGIILPRPAGEGVEFVVTTPDGGKYAAALSSDFEFFEGQVHTFNLRLKSPAEISATIEPWIEGPTRDFDVIRVVTGLGVTQGFADDHELDLFLKEGDDPDFSRLQTFTFDENNKVWNPGSPIYWESITGTPSTFRGATIFKEALNDSQMADILISKDIEVSPYTGVNLEMEHVGSRVTVELQSSDGTFTETDLKSATVVLPNYLNSGSYNEKGVFVPGTTEGSIIPENGEAIFPPQIIDNGKNLLTVTLNGRLYEVKVEETEGFEYKKGHHYRLILDLSKAKVEMSAIIKPWVEETITFEEVRVGSVNLGENTGDLLNGDQLYLFSGDDVNRAMLPGGFVYNAATDTWTYSGPSAPLYWEDIPADGSLYASITRPAINASEGNNQSADYIAAIPIVNKGGTDNTALNFELAHKVAKVNVILRSNTYDENKLLNANITLPDYEIGGKLDKGVYVPGTNKGTIALGKPSESGNDPDVIYSASSYLQPQVIALGKDLVTVEIDGRIYTVKPEDVKDVAATAIQYEAGKVTNLIITIEKTALSVSVEVTGWTELPALEFEGLFFSVSNKASAGFEDNDQIKLYKLAAGGNSVEGIVNTYQYQGGSDNGVLNPVGTPWYRDDFETGDLITAVYPFNTPALASGESTFLWTAKSTGVTNAHEDDIMIAAPVADRNLGEIQSNGDVAFEFKHVLSKISINLIAGEGFTPNEIRPFVVEMNNFRLAGSVNVINGIATPSGDVTDAFNPSKLDNVYPVTGKTVVSSYEAFVMPQTITGNTIIVTVRLGDGIFEVSLPADKLFAAGAHNMLNLTLNKTGVELSASIVDWFIEDPIDVELH